MKKGANILRRILAMAFAVAFLVSMLPTQLAAEAAEGDQMNFTANGKTIEGSYVIGTALTLTAATTGTGSSTTDDDREDTEYYYGTGGGYSAGDTYTEESESWTWESGNDAVSVSAEDGTATVTATGVVTNATITATYTETVKSGKVTNVWSENDGEMEVLFGSVTTTVWTGTYTLSSVYDTVGSITLSETDLNLNLVDNTTATLEATLEGANGGTVDPSTAVSYNTAGSDVVTLSGNDVTAVGIGTDTITASVGSVTATCTVTVSEVTETETGSYVSMTYGDSQTLEIDTDGYTSVNYTSSDANVVAFDESDGKTLVAVGVGYTTVTVTLSKTGYTKTITYRVTVGQKELTVEYSGDPITKESDGTANVTDANKTAIEGALSLSGALDGDDVSPSINECYYNSADVGSTTIKVVVDLDGTDADNYTLSSSVVELSASITPATPDEDELDLTTSGSTTLALSDDESITFTAPTCEDADGNLWFTSGEKLELEEADSCTLYTDAACGTEFDGAMTEGESQTQELYVKTSDGVVYGPITVTYNYDATAPETSTTVSGGNGNSGSIDFTNDMLTYTVTVTETGSGVNSSSIKYYISSSKEEPTGSTWVTPNITDNEDGTYTFTVATSARGYLYVTAADYTENTTTELIEKPVVIEQTAPAIDSFTDADDGDDHTAATAATDHSFTFVAADEGDNSEGNYYSGIMKVEFTLTDTENSSNVYTYTWTQSAAPTSLDDLSDYQHVEVSFSLAEAFGLTDPTGTYELTAVVTDYCGNTTATAEAITVIVDNDAPTATLTMTNGTEYGDVDGDGTYYYNATNAGFTVTLDDYTISQGVTYTITAADEDKNGVKKTGTVTGTSDITFTATELAGLTDGTITVTVTVTDAAGNETEALDYDETEGIEANVDGMTFTFVLDTTAPVLEDVTLTEGSYYSSDSAVYYNGGFEAVYTITDTNFYEDTEEGVILDNASPTSGSTGTLGNDAELSVDADSGEVTVSVAGKSNVENSIYAPTVTVTDKAGNAMVNNNAAATYGYVTVNSETGKATLTAALVLDTLAPELTSTSSPGSDYYYSGDRAVYYNTGFTVTYVVTEVNYDSDLADWSADQTGDGSDAALDSSRSGSSITYTATVAYKSGVESASYAPVLTVTDKAGNALEAGDSYNANDYDTVTVSGGTATADTAFVLDTTAPVFTLSLTNRTDTDPDSDSYAYYNTNISAAFTVKDAHLDEGKTAVATASNTSATTYDTATVSWVSMTLEQSNSSYSSTTWSQTLTASADGVYRFQVAAEDCAGNKLVQSDESSLAAYKTTTAHGSGQFWTTYYLVRDTVAPELEVTMKAGGSTFYNATLLSSGGYTVSQNNPYQPYSAATATLEKTDNSPTSVAYTFSSTTTNQTQSGSAYNHADLTVNLNGQQIFTISKLQITDRAGNVSAMSGETNKIYLDTEAPEVDEFAPTVAISGVTTAAVRGDAGTDLYDQDVTVRAVVVDPDSGVSSSGLYQVYYKVLVNGNDWTGQVTVNGTGNVTAAGTIGYGTSGSTYSSTAAVDETITSRDTILFTFDADTFNYNDVEIYVWAEDNSGNLLSEANAAYYHFGIDVTDPTITVRYDNNNAQNEKYFNADRIATITVTERNFDPNNTTVSTEAAATISGWTYTAGNAANGDDDTWTCTVTYSADGDYTFDVTTTDLVGHQAGDPDYGDSVAPTEFTIDQTNPVISVVFDNNDVRNLKYYNAYRTATITIDEHNFSTDGVTVVTTAKLDGNAIAEPTAGAWSSNNDLNSAAVPFLTDGDYTMTVSFTDLAGNEAEVVVIEEFTVDTVEPELEINDLENETAYSGDVAPWLEYSDINLEEESASITIVGYSNTTARTLSGTYDDSAQHGTFTCDNLEVTQAMDDVYTATIRVSDLAGNVNEEVWTFSVNRYGSNFILSDETEALVNQYYTNVPQEVHVIEINVNETETQTVTANINGSVVTLTLNEDYEVEDSGTGWHYYDYYVSADALSTEGSYDITFTSVDTAGNTNSNRAVKQDGETKDLPVKYVLDMTSPVNIITGVDDGSQYIAANRDIVLQCSDNVALDSISLELYFDDEYVETYPGDELWDEDAQAWVYHAEAQSSWQTIKLVSTDKAGNESTVTQVRFLLTKNLAVQYYNNKPIFFGSLILLLLILLFLFFILFKRRKKDEDEDAAGQAAGAAK